MTNGLGPQPFPPSGDKDTGDLLQDLPNNQVPYNNNGELAGSGIQVLQDGAVLMPKDLGVEGASIDFGDVATLSEANSFMRVTNAQFPGVAFDLLDSSSAPGRASSRPSQFRLTAAEQPLDVYTDDNEAITTGPVIFDVSATGERQVNKIVVKLAAQMTNVHVRVKYKTGNETVIKYWPSKAQFLDHEGVTVNAGAQTLDFSTSPFRISGGDVYEIEIHADNYALLGDATGNPYLQVIQQPAERKELAYLDDIGGPQPNTDLIPESVLTVDSENKATSSEVAREELEHLKGVNENIQDQLNAAVKSTLSTSVADSRPRHFAATDGANTREVFSDNSNVITSGALFVDVPAFNQSRRVVQFLFDLNEEMENVRLEVRYQRNGESFQVHFPSTLDWDAGTGMTLPAGIRVLRLDNYFNLEAGDTYQIVIMADNYAINGSSGNTPYLRETYQPAEYKELAYFEEVNSKADKPSITPFRSTSSIDLDAEEWRQPTLGVPLRVDGFEFAANGPGNMNGVNTAVLDVAAAGGNNVVQRIRSTDADAPNFGLRTWERAVEGQPSLPPSFKTDWYEVAYKNQMFGNRVAITDSVGYLDHSPITADELSQLDNVRSNVQGQIDSKVDKVPGKGLSDLNYTAADKSKVDEAVTPAELNSALLGVSSSIPEQGKVTEIVIGYDQSSLSPLASLNGFVTNMRNDGNDSATLLINVGSNSGWFYSTSSSTAFLNSGAGTGTSLSLTSDASREFTRTIIYGKRPDGSQFEADLSVTWNGPLNADFTALIKTFKG